MAVIPAIEFLILDRELTLPTRLVCYRPKDCFIEFRVTSSRYLFSSSARALSISCPKSSTSASGSCSKMDRLAAGAVADRGMEFGEEFGVEFGEER